MEMLSGIVSKYRHCTSLRLSLTSYASVTVQDIGDLKSLTPPDPTKFAFFKGIDDDGNKKGLLQAVITGGLPTGTYRVCTMIAARNHQPVNMPVAQRGAQDDCTKFKVIPSNKGGKTPSKNAKDGDGSRNVAEEGDTIAMPTAISGGDIPAKNTASVMSNTNAAAPTGKPSFKNGTIVDGQS